TLVCSSCIGSFSLFNKYEKWQCNMTGSKFVNGIVGLILQPIVGGVCLFVDAVVLNTIEFWSGNNPMQANVGKTIQVQGQDGRYYAVKILRDGYEVTAPEGQVTVFKHNSADDSWQMIQNGVTKDIFRFNADGTIQAFLPGGGSITVGNDQAGLDQVQRAITFDAARDFAAM
ncbi:MAG: DUF3332 domain-containing protein, partial [Prevotella sp.]|nr:DUF3332 domain-containing protein [Prevotella sp.]